MNFADAHDTWNPNHEYEILFLTCFPFSGPTPSIQNALATESVTPSYPKPDYIKQFTILLFPIPAPQYPPFTVGCRMSKRSMRQSKS